MTAAPKLTERRSTDLVYPDNENDAMDHKQKSVASNQSPNHVTRSWRLGRALFIPPPITRKPAWASGNYETTTPTREIKYTTTSLASGCHIEALQT